MHDALAPLPNQRRSGKSCFGAEPLGKARQTLCPDRERALRCAKRTRWGRDMVRGWPSGAGPHSPAAVRFSGAPQTANARDMERRMAALLRSPEPSMSRETGNTHAFFSGSGKNVHPAKPDARCLQKERWLSAGGRSDPDACRGGTSALYRRECGGCCCGA